VTEQMPNVIHLASDDRKRVLCTGEPWPVSRGERQSGMRLECPDCLREVERLLGWREVP
jgi:hypothetical protein